MIKKRRREKKEEKEGCNRKHLFAGYSFYQLFCNFFSRIHLNYSSVQRNSSVIALLPRLPSGPILLPSPFLPSVPQYGTRRSSLSSSSPLSKIVVLCRTEGREREKKERERGWRRREKELNRRPTQSPGHISPKPSPSFFLSFFLFLCSNSSSFFAREVPETERKKRKRKGGRKGRGGLCQSLAGRQAARDWSSESTDLILILSLSLLPFLFFLLLHPFSFCALTDCERWKEGEREN